MTDEAEEHQRLIVDQFTKQAIPFSQMPDHSPGLILAASQVGPTDTVLDVACGPPASEGYLKAEATRREATAASRGCCL